MSLPENVGHSFTGDLATYDDDQLEGLRYIVAAEIERRRVLATAQEQAKQIVDAYRQAADANIPEGEYPPWKQPTGAHDAYNMGYFVSHKDKIWESLRDGNPDEPGVASWREYIPPSDNGVVTYPAWVQPTGAHDAYSEGDRVTHPKNDVLHVWLNTHPGERTNVWEPGAFSGWQEEGPA